MINLTAAALTDTGLVRNANEDSALAQVYYANKEPIGLFAVCDGMGGHMGGEFASYWALEAVKHELADLFASDDPRATIFLSKKALEKARLRQHVSPDIKPAEVDIEERLRAAIQKANQVVYEYARRKPEKAADAGTTITMAVVLGNHAVIANIGDSRTYLLRNRQLRQITRDHSLVANLVLSGQILPDEVYNHPQRNVIYRFLGQKASIPPDIYHEVLRPGDYLLFCSDGLWEMVRDEQYIVELIEGARTPKQACQELVQAANAAGGEDNIGIAVVKIARGLRYRPNDIQAVW